jgi:hypothetical protein
MTAAGLLTYCAVIDFRRPFTCFRNKAPRIEIREINCDKQIHEIGSVYFHALKIQVEVF